MAKFDGEKDMLIGENEELKRQLDQECAQRNTQKINMEKEKEDATDKLKKHMLPSVNTLQKPSEPTLLPMFVFFTVDQQMLRLHLVFLPKKILMDSWSVELLLRMPSATLSVPAMTTNVYENALVFIKA